jgi:hypothetical protein
MKHLGVAVVVFATESGKKRGCIKQEGTPGEKVLRGGCFFDDVTIGMGSTSGA